MTAGAARARSAAAGGPLPVRLDRSALCGAKAASSATDSLSPVDFPRRCPLPRILGVPFGKEEFAVISRCFKSRYRDFAPSAYAPRYQTAGSIGALARDEPVTPGVTFLSHPAPNSEDTDDR